MASNFDFFVVVFNIDVKTLTSLQHLHRNREKGQRTIITMDFMHYKLTN